MPPLDSGLRRQLESAVIEARDVAEKAAQSALQKRGVEAAEAFPHFGPKEKSLRNRLRARGRQAGDVRKGDKTQSIDQLTQELAYEYWHRMLFARFLAENHLLMHSSGVPVSLDECEELAPTETPPAANKYVLAARYASRMLPQIFRTDDVLLEIEFAPEHRQALEKLLAGLPRATFLADDSLGWVYQFWQSKRKDEVNKSGEKIDGRTLPAVTQLFTEHYMVEFLLHNTIGAWWCARHGVKGLPDGAGIPAGRCPVEMRYLRWRDDGTPAAGTFDEWPKTLAEFTMLDPCCGSGHFLVAAFNLLVPLRMHDEKITALAACDAVLNDNIFGLELDPRCTQIAAFALALAAWKFPDAGGYRPLPKVNIACSGIGPQATQEEWLDLARKSGLSLTAVSRDPVLNGLQNLHEQFSNASTLGSLVDPHLLRRDVVTADFETIHPYLTAAMVSETSSDDVHERAVAAAGIIRAADLLSRDYVLVATNVPYLAYGSHHPVLSSYLTDNYEAGKTDLATAFTTRCQRFAVLNGCVAIVTPQNWLYGDYFEDFRAELLEQVTLRLCCLLGPRAFSAIPGEVVKPQLLIFTNAVSRSNAHLLRGLDINDVKGAESKSTALIDAKLAAVSQHSCRLSAGNVISFALPSKKKALLSEFVEYSNGIQSGDLPRFGRQFWELEEVSADWAFQQTTTATTGLVGGLHNAFYWQRGNGEFVNFVKERLGDQNSGSWIRGIDFVGKKGVAISPTGKIKCAMFLGTLFDDNTIVLIPKKPAYFPAVVAFCLSEEYGKAVRSIDKSLKVRGALVKVSFDLERWETEANRVFPKGIPQLSSPDPTQWLFDGDVPACSEPLHAAVAIMLGYTWPKQPSLKDSLQSACDADGVVSLRSVRGEPTAAERLIEVLRITHGTVWSNAILTKLLSDVDCPAGATLDHWLGAQFFEQHARLFHNRPFIWQIWDGRKDGFSALVNYHKLTHKSLENLTYSYLGDWIKEQKKSNKVGADLRLSAAESLQEKLKLILAGEPPYDIFVRWKPLSEQVSGWYPDLNDGVRMNIRPFVLAGVLRKTLNIKWTKDRGEEPERPKDEFPWFWKGNTFVGDRVNDVHLTLAQKQDARGKMKSGGNRR